MKGLLHRRATRIEMEAATLRIRSVIAATLAVLLVFLAFGLLGGGLMVWPGMMHYGYGYCFGYGLRYSYGILPWLGIGALLFRTLIVTAGLLIFVELLRHRRQARTGAVPVATRPIEIVRERYARGEITKEQFDQMRQDLEDR